MSVAGDNKNRRVLVIDDRASHPVSAVTTAKPACSSTIRVVVGATVRWFLKRAYLMDSGRKS